jgi:hypothetical protein
LTPGASHVRVHFVDPSGVRFTCEGDADDVAEMLREHGYIVHIDRDYN